MFKQLPPVCMNHVVEEGGEISWEGDTHAQWGEKKEEGGGVYVRVLWAEWLGLQMLQWRLGQRQHGREIQSGNI
jgi:hypothetical protein